MKRFKLTSGFTLVELLVVITVIAILATAGLVGLRGAQVSARDAKRVADVGSLQAPMEVYYARYGSYPTTAQGLNILFTTGIISRVPTPPPPTVAYGYTGCTGGQDYVINVSLERTSTAVDGDVDTNPCNVACGTGGSAQNELIFCVSN